MDGNDYERYAKGRWPIPIYYYAVEKGGQRPPRQYDSSEPGPEDEDVAQELCHVEADDEDNDGLVEGGLSVVHDLRDLRYGVSHAQTIVGTFSKCKMEPTKIRGQLWGYLHAIVHVKERGREIGPLEAQRVLLGCNSIDIYNNWCNNWCKSRTGSGTTSVLGHYMSQN